MAGSYTPTVSSFSNGSVSVVSTDSTPYQEIQASMGSVLYQLEEMYLVSSNQTQISEPLTFREYSVNGNIRKILDTPVIDPYQFQKALFYTPQKEVIFNGNTSLKFNVQPLTSVRLIFYVKQLANSMLLKEPSLLQDYFFEQQFSFFGGFKDEIL